MIVGWPIASIVAGRLLLKTGFRPLIVGGLGLSVVGTGVMALWLRPDAPLRWVLGSVAIKLGGRRRRPAQAVTSST